MDCLDLVRTAIFRVHAEGMVGLEHELYGSTMAHILLVEDDKLLLKCFGDVLGVSGHVVGAATTVSEARTRLASESYDVILTDLRLGDGTGIELADLAVSNGIKALIVTGFARDLTADLLEKYHFLLKPVLQNELVSAVTRMMGGVTSGEVAPAHPITSSPQAPGAEPALEPRATRSEESVINTAVRHLREGRCPDCGQSRLIKGSIVGMSRNVRCRDCGARWGAYGALHLLKDTLGAERLDNPADRHVLLTNNGYRDSTQPERLCHYCGQPYRGRAAYCCFACAVADQPG